MTQKSERYFIFSWKEILVISLLAVISVGFFFTLGLHYGKKVHVSATNEVTEYGKLEGSPETLPSRDSLEQASRHALVATEDTIKQATEEELKKSGVKMEAPKQVDLPSEKVIAKKAATPKTAEKSHADKSHTEKSHTEKSQADAYGIQVGSFPNRSEANSVLKTLSKKSIESEVIIAKVGGKTRFRLVVSGFHSRKDAEEKAKRMKAQSKIDSFVIIRL